MKQQYQIIAVLQGVFIKKRLSGINNTNQW